MSFIREIVQIAKENDVADARKNISKINSEIKNFQHKIKKYIDAEYVDFLPVTANNDYYFEEGSRLCDETKGILDSVDGETKQDLFNATEELSRHCEELQELQLGLRSSLKILKIDELFQNLKQMNENSDNYMRIIHLLDELKTLVNDPQDKILRRLDCYENIKIRYRMETEQLLHNIKRKFEALVQLNEKAYQSTKVVDIRITKDDNQLHDVVVALFKTKYNPKRVFDFLLHNVFAPIIQQPVSIELNNEDPRYAHLELSYSLKPLADDLRPNYKTVFQHIQTVFQCLGYMNVSLAGGDTEQTPSCIFALFAAQVRDEFFELLTHQCLTYAIPGTIDEMNESTLIGDTQAFHHFLQEMMFLGEQDVQLLEYAEKIECLFRKRFCANILDTAVDLMRKDLHDMVVMDDSDAKVVKQEMDASAVAGSNGGSSILFARCMVSKSVLELTALLEKIMKQAGRGGDEITEQLYGSVACILERYVVEVPQYHAKLLATIPQQTALFHNNCSYLAYWTTKNTANKQQVESFAVISNAIRGEGVKLFGQQMANQKRQLMEILYELDFAEHINELGPGPTKIVRQCLRQLEVLKNVWQIILPTQVYNKSMGALLNDFCGEIIKRICSLEDISSEVANGLVDLIGTILEKAPSIFEDALQVSIHVKLWTKMSQLRMILGASLLQIIEQWSEGKGPLTLNFKPEDVKNLIRALFQNTDRRANALASII